jgi:tetratricopeptide (TPR) repeat protein
MISKQRTLAILFALSVSVFLGWQGLKMALADYAYNLGTLYRMRGMWDACVEAFTEAATLSAPEVKYVVYKGLAYEEKAKNVPDDQKWPLIEKAIAAYQEGVRMNPTNAYYIGNLGRAYGFAGAVKNDPAYYQKSVEAFQLAVKYAPVTVLFYQNLAMTYFNNKDEVNFWKIIDRLAAFDKKEAAKLVFNCANQFYNTALFDKARAYYERALTLDAEYVEAYFNLGVILVQLNKPAQAIAQWQKALTLKPDFEPAKQMLIRYQTETNPLEKRVKKQP